MAFYFVLGNAKRPAATDGGEGAGKKAKVDVKDEAQD